MKAIILAAGYGTRLDNELNRIKKENPLQYKRISHSIRGKPKPLVLIGGKPLLNYVVENMIKAGIEEIIIVTNNKYITQFENWLKNCSLKIPVKLLNDGTNSNGERLGALNDLLLALNNEKIDDDVLVFAGDNLVKFELSEMVDFFRQKKTTIICTYKEKEKERLKRHGCIEFDENSLVTYFEEKPDEPKSKWVCPAIYIFAKETINLIKNMEFGEDKKDLIGNIPLLLYRKMPIYAFKKESNLRFDLGTMDDFEKADEYFRSKKE
ncbi:nucleotidyltransferase family protein [candidate division KSB1 bacterium]